MTAAEEFEALVRRHDLTYFAADDYASWKRGAESMKQIQSMAREIGLDVAAPIWNRIVDLKITPESRADYYWPISVPDGIVRETCYLCGGGGGHSCALCKGRGHTVREA